MIKQSILIIIPARGGSQSIKRKNLRILNGKPLIYYSINNALNIKYKADVFVSSDDNQILNISKKFGSNIIKRGRKLSTDKITLDPVIYHALKSAEKISHKIYDIVITLQPTSPTLKTKTLNNAIKFFLKKNLDTLISACKNNHLTWKTKGSKFVKNFKKRLCRQYMPKIYRETGAFLITKRKIISKNNRLGKNIELFILDDNEKVDIDTHYDWAMAEYILKRKKVVFTS